MQKNPMVHVENHVNIVLLALVHSPVLYPSLYLHQRQYGLQYFTSRTRKHLQNFCVDAHLVHNRLKVT